MFSITVPENRKVSCSTIPSWRRRSAFRIVADVPAVDGDPAAVDLVEAGQQVDDGRLARAGRPDQGQRLPGSCFQGHLLDDGRPGW